MYKWCFRNVLVGHNLAVIVKSICYLYLHTHTKHTKKSFTLIGLFICLDKRVCFGPFGLFLTDSLCYSCMVYTKIHVNLYEACMFVYNCITKQYLFLEKCFMSGWVFVLFWGQYTAKTSVSVHISSLWTKWKQYLGQRFSLASALVCLVWSVVHSCVIIILYRRYRLGQSPILCQQNK